MPSKVWSVKHINPQNSTVVRGSSLNSINKRGPWHKSSKSQWMLIGKSYSLVIRVPHIDGILPKGLYPPCLRMADRALLAGYPRYMERHWCLTQWMKNKMLNHEGICVIELCQPSSMQLVACLMAPPSHYQTNADQSPMRSTWTHLRHPGKAFEYFSRTKSLNFKFLLMDSSENHYDLMLR